MIAASQLRQCRASLNDVGVFVVTGREAIFARSVQLEELAIRSGQPGAMHGLRLLLGSRYAIRKRPHLICFGVLSNAANLEQSPLEGAVLLLEYRIGNIGTGLFATADSFGVRTVVAPAHLRASFALAANEAMLQHGARIVLISFKDSTSSPFLSVEHSTKLPGSSRYLFAMQRRQVQDTFLLRGSLEETLGTMGKRTRVHMRAARRRFNRMLPHANLTDASTALASTTDKLRHMNATSLDTIDQRDFDHQMRSVSEEKDSFVLGLRDGARWLALVAGWRQGDATWVEWQVNAAGYEKLSIGSVMRSYFLEHEIGMGMRQVSFHGGTSHSMVHSFVKEDVIDLLGKRPGMMNTAFVMIARRLCALFPHLRQRGNFLLDALAADGLTWSSEIDGDPGFEA